MVWNAKIVFGRYILIGESWQELCHNWFKAGQLFLEKHIVFWDPNSSPCWGRCYMFLEKFTQVFFWGSFQNKLRLCSFSNSFTGVFCWEVKVCWGSVLVPTVYWGILLGGSKLIKQCYFSTVYWGILLGGVKNWGSVLFQKVYFSILLGGLKTAWVLSYGVLDFTCMVCTCLGPGTFEYVANS